uniref:Uncharacterized protein n=1 Tax=Arundo donax TaxID=35708 RepID=A0A0A9BMH5_ARUDO
MDISFISSLVVEVALLWAPCYEEKCCGLVGCSLQYMCSTAIKALPCESESSIQVPSFLQ